VAQKNKSRSAPSPNSCKRRMPLSDELSGQETIVDLPLVNRNYTEILGLTAGINTDIVDATQLGAGSQEIRANGARSGDNNFMMNGVDANSYGSNITEITPFGGAGIAIPAPDTIQDFKVQTSLYDAQYGRGGGANANVETRSGTTDCCALYAIDLKTRGMTKLLEHVYYFGRNEALDANNFFTNATGVPRGEFRRSQPGGTLGGPMPWSRKRAFYFVSYQATRDVNAASLSSSVRSSSLPPIPQVRTPASLGAVFGGQTGVFGGMAVAPDGSNINPVALNLLNAKNPDGRSILRGPDQRVGDIIVIKTTPVTERVKLIFRWEVFNALNRPNFANPSNDVSTPSTFGVISSLTVNPRIMQYALKLEF
jgi:hypothetical protein